MEHIYLSRKHYNAVMYYISLCWTGTVLNYNQSELIAKHAREYKKNFSGLT